MPPKGRKRKAVAEEKHVAEENEVAAAEEEEEAPKGKKAKKEPKKKEPVVPLDPSIPTNVTVPLSLAPYPAKEGTLKLCSYNVCSLPASSKKGLDRYILAEDPDILILTETKVDAQPAGLDFLDGWKWKYWGSDPVKKSYCGIAALCKVEPVKVEFGLPTLEPQSATAGRLVTLEFPNTYVVGTYVVNAGQDLKTLDAKKKWNVAFEEYLRLLDAKKPVIWCGDLNVAATELDIRNAKTNYNKTAGYTQDEIDGFHSQLNPPADGPHKPLVDAWRHLHPGVTGHYTYYSYRFQARTKGIGWRIDSFIVSERLLPSVDSCEIRHEIWGASDHIPVVMHYKGDL